MTSQPRQAKAQPPITHIYETGSETRPLVCINQCQAREATFVVSGGINRATRDWKIKSCGSLGSDDSINSSYWWEYIVFMHRKYLAKNA